MALRSHTRASKDLPALVTHGKREKQAFSHKPSMSHEKRQLSNAIVSRARNRALKSKMN